MCNKTFIIVDIYESTNLTELDHYANWFEKKLVEDQLKLIRIIATKILSTSWVKIIWNKSTFLLDPMGEVFKKIRSQQACNALVTTSVYNNRKNLSNFFFILRIRVYYNSHQTNVTKRYFFYRSIKKKKKKRYVYLRS